MTAIRRGEPGDLKDIACLQASAPEAAHWEVEEYLQYDLRVAFTENRLAGFLVGRMLAPGEAEILNLAVAPDLRRHGIAAALVKSFLQDFPGAVFLEVRASNSGARQFYKYLHFQEISTRTQYYESPPDAAIVMKFHSC